MRALRLAVVGALMTGGLTAPLVAPALTPVARADGASGYTFTDLGTDLFPAAVNDNGVVVGSAYIAAGPAAYVATAVSHGSRTLLAGFASDRDSNANDINDAGQIVGQAEGGHFNPEDGTSTEYAHAAGWTVTSPGTVVDLGHVGADNRSTSAADNIAPDGTLTGPTAYNDSASRLIYSSFERLHGTGPITEIGTPDVHGNGPETCGVSADHHLLVNYDGTRILASPTDPGVKLDFDVFCGNAGNGVGHQMSDNGSVVGRRGLDNVVRAPDGTETVLHGTGINQAVVNDSGAVAGVNSSNHAVLISGGVTTDLATLVPVGWTQLSVIDLANDGDLVGRGTLDGVDHSWLLERTQAFEISDVAIDPATPTTTDGTISGTVTLRNTTDHDLTAASASVSSQTPDLVSVTTQPAPASSTVPAGTSRTLSFSMVPGKEGTAKLAVTATAKDGSKTLAATPRTRTFVISDSDLSVSLKASPAPTTNSPVTLTATVTNVSGVTVTGLTPSLTVTPSTGTTLGDPSPATVASLSPHASTTVTWTFTTTVAASYTLEAQVQATDPVTGDQTQTASKQLSVTGGTVTVNSTDDTAEPPASLTDGICDVDRTTAGSQCTLRAAIALVNSLTDPQSIVFDVPGGDVPRIAPASRLPTVSSSVVIDGTTQAAGWVQLSGSASSADDGLTLSGADATVTGLVVNGWVRGAGIELSGARATVRGDRIGTDVAGTSALGNLTGIRDEGTEVTVGGVSGTSTTACTGDCVLISGNDYGVVVDEAGRLSVEGSYVGTDVTGGSAVGNQNGIANTERGNPLFSDGRAGDVVIGGGTTSPGTAPGNVISGNSFAGISLVGIGQVTVAGNLIGLDSSGTRTLQPTVPVDQRANEKAGVYVDGDRGVTVGGASEADMNVISGFPVGVFHSTRQTADSNLDVRNDRIGTDAAGTGAVPNAIGVGNAHSISDSLVSGNGLGIYGADLVAGDRIGTTADGTGALPNDEGVIATQVGGARPSGSTTCETPCNVISGNRGAGIGQADTVQGNFIGTDLTGRAALPNNTTSTDPSSFAVGATVRVGGPSHATTGTCDLACNLISGNASSAVAAIRLDGVTVQGNTIGVGIGDGALPNHGPGVVTAVGATVGGDGALGNRIEDNLGAAVEESRQTGLGSGATGVVRGNVMSGNTAGLLIDPGVAGRVTRAPLLVGAVRTPTGLVVTGDVLDQPTASGFTSRLDVYGVTDTCTHSPQGEVPLGHVETGILSDGSFTFTDTSVPSAVRYVTVTSTQDGHTSTFAACVPVGGATTVDPAPGGRESVSGPGFAPNEKVDVTLHSTPVRLVTVTASSAGLASAAVTIPAKTTAGPHELILTGATSHHRVILPITVTPAAQAGLLHPLAPRSVFAKVVRGSVKAPLLGRGGVPRKGVKQVLVLASATTAVTVAGKSVAARSTRLLALPSTPAVIRAAKASSVRLTVLGWTAAAKSQQGDVLRPLTPSPFTKSGKLLAGSHGLPYVGVDAAVLTVTSVKAGTVVGGIRLAPSKVTTTVVVRLVKGAAVLTLAKGAKVKVIGWYAGPAVAAGGTTAPPGG